MKQIQNHCTTPAYMAPVYVVLTLGHRHRRWSNIFPTKLENPMVSVLLLR